MRIVECLIGKSTLLEQHFQLLFPKSTNRIIADIAADPIKLFAGMILFCTCKILQSIAVFDSNDQFPLLFKIGFDLLEEIPVGCIGFRKSTGIFEYAIEGNIVKFLHKLDIIEIAYDNFKVIIGFMPLIVDR